MSTLNERRDARLRKQYGLSWDEYRYLYERQNGLCALCGKHQRLLHTDHNHTTGDVRGLLCTPCNTALGKMGDTREALLRAAEYAGSDLYIEILEYRHHLKGRKSNGQPITDEQIASAPPDMQEILRKLQAWQNESESAHG